MFLTAVVAWTDRKAVLDISQDRKAVQNWTFHKIGRLYETFLIRSSSLLNSIVSKTNFIWFGVKLLQRSNTQWLRTKMRRSHSLKLSSAWWRRDNVSSVRFLTRPADNNKKPNSYENTLSLTWNRFGLPWSVLFCSAAYSGCYKNRITVLMNLNCFVYDLSSTQIQTSFSPFRTFRRKSCQQAWNLVDNKNEILSLRFHSRSCQQDVNTNEIFLTTRMKSCQQEWNLVDNLVNKNEEWNHCAC